MSIVIAVNKAVTTALDVDVPIDRTSEFSPFDAAVSVIGTDCMMRIGMAE